MSLRGTKWRGNLTQTFMRGDCHEPKGSRNDDKTKKQRTMKYTAPEFDVFEVAVEGGYGNSTLLPGFGSEEDELIY